MKIAFSILLLSVLCLVSAAGLELRIVYDEPREVSAITASLQEGGRKSSLGIFGKAGVTIRHGRFAGEDALLATLPLEGRKVDVSVAAKIEGLVEPPGLLRFLRPERVSRIDCFEDDSGIVIYVHADSGIRKIVFHRDRAQVLEIIGQDAVPEMKSPLLLTFAKGKRMPVIR